MSNQKRQVTVGMETRHEVCADHWNAGCVKLEESAGHTHGDAGEVAVAATQPLPNMELVKPLWNDNHCQTAELASLLLLHSH